MNWTISFIKALLDGKSRASESYFFSLASIASVCTLAKKKESVTKFIFCDVLFFISFGDYPKPHCNFFRMTADVKFFI